MVKLFHLSVLLKPDNQAQQVYSTSSAASKVKCLRSTSDLSSFGFFQRSSVSEFMQFSSKLVVERSSCSSRCSVTEKDVVCHAYIMHNRLAAVLISDQEYPTRVAHTLLNRVLDEFVASVPVDQWSSCREGQALFHNKLEQYLAKYQNPKQADAMTRIENDLDETKIALHSAITSILERGEKLDNLVEKSDELSAQSKIFYKTARKTNQCCSYY